MGPAEDSLAHLFAALCLIALLGLLMAEVRGRRDVRIACKTTASLAFVLYAIAMGAAQAGPAGVMVLVALGLSVVGDVALLGTGMRAIGAGVFAFALAHLAYAAAFVFLGVVPLVAVGAAAVVAIPASAVWGRLREPAGPLAKPVLAYIVIISAMVAAAAGSLGAAWVSGDTAVRGGLLAAAIAFYLSDLCVARERFVTHDVGNKLVGLPLYYGAQLGFAGLIGHAP